MTSYLSRWQTSHVTDSCHDISLRTPYQPRREKSALGHVRPAKTQISLRICAAFVVRMKTTLTGYRKNAKTLIRVCGCAWECTLFHVVYHITKTPYSNILKISPPKTESSSDKKFDIFHISAQNIDCVYSLEPPRRGGSNGYPQSMFLSRNKKNNVYPCKPQFYYIKVGF